MGDDTISVAIADLTRSYARDNNVAVNTSFAPEDEQETQIMEEGAGDVLITSNEEWIDDLKLKGLVDAGSTTPIARDQLVLAGPADSTLAVPDSGKFPTAQILDAIGHEPGFVIGTPEALPEGLYAREALHNLGVAGELEPYTLYPKNRRQMFEMVETRHAYGLFFYSTAIRRPGIRVISALPDDTYGPIQYYAVVIASNNMDQARKFIDYLKSIPAKNILKARGFLSD